MKNHKYRGNRKRSFERKYLNDKFIEFVRLIIFSHKYYIYAYMDWLEFIVSKKINFVIHFHRSGMKAQNFEMTIICSIIFGLLSFFLMLLVFQKCRALYNTKNAI